MLPGFGLMLLLSWTYVRYGLSNAYFRASLEAMNTAVAALYMRAVHKIGQHAVISTETAQVNWILLSLIMISIGMQVFMRVHFFITLAVIAVASKRSPWVQVFSLSTCSLLDLAAQKRIYWGLILILALGNSFLLRARLSYFPFKGVPLYVFYIIWVGYPHGFSFGINMGKPTYWSAFLLGLIAGLVSVGGAFSGMHRLSFSLLL